MNTPGRRYTPLLVGLVLTSLLGLTACGPEADSGDAPDPRQLLDTTDLKIPSPDLGQIEPTLRQAVQDLSTDLAAKAASGDADPEELAAAFGSLGQIYHTYELKDAALICYDNASRLTAEPYKWEYLSAYLIQHDGRLEEAAERYDRALEADPQAVPAMIRAGELNLQLADAETAHLYFRRALERAPDSASALFGEGKAFLAEGDSEAARQTFLRVLELQPDASIVRFQLARAYRQLGDTEAAQAQLALRGTQGVSIDDPAMKELLDIRTLTAFRVIDNLITDPGDVTAVELLSFTLMHLGDRPDAVGFLEGLLIQAKQKAGEENRPQRARLHYLLGAVLVFQNHDEIAVQHFATAVELEPQLTDAYVKLGNGLARTGRLEEAAETFTQALAIDPEAWEIRLKRATILLNLGRIEEGQTEFREALQRDPGNPLIRVRLAESLEAAGSPQAAEQAFLEAVALDLPDADLAIIHRGLGDFHLRRRDSAAAIADYRRAVELDRTLNSARSKLAAVLGLVGQYQEAAAEYRLVVNSQPGRSEPRLKEAAALILDRQYAEARDRLEEGVAALPRSAALAQQLAQLLAAAPDADIRDGARARELAWNAFRTRPGPTAAETLAMAYAEEKSFTEAREWQQRALEQSPRPVSPALEARFELYRQDRPYRAAQPGDLLVPLGG